MEKFNTGEEPYEFKEQLSYSELTKIIEDKTKQWSDDEIMALLQNDIIISARQTEKTVALDVNDGVQSTFTYVQSESGEYIETDHDERVKTPHGGFLFPNATLAFARTATDKLELVTKCGGFSIHTLPEEFIDKYVNILEGSGAIKRNEIYSPDINDFLVEKGILTILK